MKSSIVFFSIVAIALSSCSSVYRTAQTPDDVYYSPGREEADSYVQMDRPNDRPGSYRNDQQGEYLNPDDRVLRMRVRNRGMWSAFDDYGYGGMGYNGMPYMGYNGLGYGGFGYGGMGYGGMAYGLGYGNSFGYNPWTYGGLGLGLGFGNYYNNFYGWNNNFNPYFGGGVIIDKPRNSPNTRIRTFNPNTYSNRGFNSTNANGSSSRPATTRPSGQNGYNNSNTNTLGTSIRRVFSSPSNNTNNSSSNRGSYYTPNNDRPVRSYSPDNSSSAPVMRTQSSGSTGGSSGSNSGGGGGGTTGGRPGRGN